MPEYLFAYGTLQPGLAPPEIAPVIAKLRMIGKGWGAGSLYDLGSYPGAIFDAASARQIHGIVYELSDSVEDLRRLDDYEGPEYMRIWRPVTLADSGSILTCWVYHYLGKPDDDRLLGSGRWADRRAGERS